MFGKRKSSISIQIMTSFLAFTLAVGLSSFLSYRLFQVFDLLKYILLSDIEKYKIGAWAILLSLGVVSIEIILGIGKGNNSLAINNGNRMFFYLSILHIVYSLR